MKPASEINKRPASKTGFARLWFAFFYSLSGLRFALTEESAFQQEVCLFAVLLVVLYFLPVSLVFKGVLLSANTLVLIVELLNTALETMADMISPDYDRRIKKVKDMGSAAVFLSILLALLLWGSAVVAIIANGSGS